MAVGQRGAACGAGHTNVYILRAGADNAHRRGRAGGYVSRALGETAADIDGMVTSHSETLTEQNGAAVLHLTVHAEEQIGTEAVDDSTIPEENVEMEQVP